VRKDRDVVPPYEVAGKLMRGEINRFEAGALTGRYYETVPAPSLIEDVSGTWADGNASPFIALAARRFPEAALAAATSVLLDAPAPGAEAGRGARAAPVGRGAGPRMAAITGLRVLEALGGDAAQGVVRRVAAAHRDVTLRSMARAALARLGGAAAVEDPALDDLRGALLNASRAEDRARAAGLLADAGDVAAIPLLRASFAGDIAADVRDASGRALGRLGDADSVDSFCAALFGRDADRHTARTAAYALGYLGDVRALGALVHAYQAGWLPDVITEALATLGRAAAPLLVHTVEHHPELLKRSTARQVFDRLDPAVLEAALVDRIGALAAAADFAQRAAVLAELVKDRAELRTRLAAHILAVRPELGTATTREARALRSKLASGRSARAAGA
jgi:hypothetical protein